MTETSYNLTKADEKKYQPFQKNRNLLPFMLLFNVK